MASTDERTKFVYQSTSSSYKFKPIVAVGLLLLLYTFLFANTWYPFLRFDYEILNCTSVICAFLAAVYLFFNCLKFKEAWRCALVTIVFIIPKLVFSLLTLAILVQTICFFVGRVDEPKIIKTVDINGCRINVYKEFVGGCSYRDYYQIKQSRNILPGLSLVRVLDKSDYHASTKVTLDHKILNNTTIEFSIKTDEKYSKSNKTVIITPKPFVYF